MIVIMVGNDSVYMLFLSQEVIKTEKDRIRKGNCMDVSSYHIHTRWLVATNRPNSC